MNLASEALQKGGNAPCVLNAANEIAVEAFLNDKISFLKIPEIIEKTMEAIAYIAKPVYEDYVKTDEQARIFAAKQS